jgi:outer membrane protein
MQVYAQQDIQAKVQEYFDPIVKRVKAAIQRVAIERGYDFVLDSSEGYNVLYCNPAHDLMMAVRTELRIPVNAKPIQMDQGY